MSNFHLFPKDGTCWLANDVWPHYIYERMRDGYVVETLFEDEFRERYPLPWDKPVKGATTTNLNKLKS